MLNSASNGTSEINKPSRHLPINGGSNASRASRASNRLRNCQSLWLSWVTSTLWFSSVVLSSEALIGAGSARLMTCLSTWFSKTQPGFCPRST